MVAGFVGAVLLLAGAAKIAGRSLSGAGTGGVVGALSRWLTPVELATGALLIAGFWWAAIPAGVLLLGFTGYVVSLVRRRLPEPCRCFGEASARPVGVVTVVRNVVLLAGAVVVAGRWDLSGWVGRVIGVLIGVGLVAAERGIGRPPATTVLPGAEDS